MLEWIDRLRKTEPDTLFADATLKPLIAQTRGHLRTLARESAITGLSPLIQAMLIPMLRVLFQTYAQSPVPAHAKPETIIAFVRTLQASLRLPSLKQALDHHQRAQRKALKNHIQKVKGHFQQHRCLTFVHVLFEREPHRQQWLHDRAQHNREFLRARTALFKACRQGRERAFVDLLGYHWRLISPLEQGLRLWMVFVFAPTNRESRPLSESPEERAQQCAAYWRETITQGWGVGLIAHGRDQPARHSAQLGLVCRDDAQAIARLQRLLSTFDALSCLDVLPAPTRARATLKGAQQQRSQGNGRGRAGQG
ncbi:hypothetical protein CKO42_09140 [Lamprobacter modestohalophilus]|uniref:Uncharacterized protein n=1 Tax=Lamprobacter modestohalophilus TaxID=1064514 RepID=A0A9X1B3N5_9GAMM|nr:hypothetical protein [Lamprobacter modestohalophilus]MBK1618600.1 hypothetical protein [Lamprobacter modestohalophilus]